MSQDTNNAVTLPSTMPAGLPDVGVQNAVVDPATAAMSQVIPFADSLASEIKNAVVNGYMRAYNAAWAMQAGLTPKQFFKALDTKAVSFLVRGGQIRAFANSVYPDLNLPGLPENYTITPAEDGSVTVEEK